ncbi:MAG TPA: flagellar type III secretion system pore protein FliP [Burkholderiaceae bacterium]|nr:flagellar type III secretion system pore protein FliP [Burkholderiaceae bacterium]
MWAPAAWGQEALPLPRIEVGIGTSEGPADVALSLQLLLLLTLITLAPAILVMLTSFTRVVVVLSFVRTAMATQQVPPNQVLIGLALFLTFYAMSPVFDQVYDLAYRPLSEGSINFQQALELGSGPMRTFMLEQTREADLLMFANMAELPPLATPDEVPMRVLIPAFVTSELKTAFQIGFTIFIPFLIIDLVVASVLMSLGMMMVPPVTISLPFKLMLFVLADGWHLLLGSLARSFYL